MVRIKLDLAFAVIFCPTFCFEEPVDICQEPVSECAQVPECVQPIEPGLLLNDFLVPPVFFFPTFSQIRFEPIAEPIKLGLTPPPPWSPTGPPVDPPWNPVPPEEIPVATIPEPSAFVIAAILTGLTALYFNIKSIKGDHKRDCRNRSNFRRVSTSPNR